MKTIDEQIKNGEFARIYVLYGEEDYLKRQYRDKLMQALVQPGDNLNFTKMEGENITVGALIDLAETMPFMAEKRVILVTESGLFKKSNEELAKYFAQCPESTCIIFVEKEIDKRSKTYKAAAKEGVVTEFSMPDENTIAKWMGARLKAEGKTITRDAWKEFVDRTGGSMEYMDREMEKLLSYTMSSDGITIEDVKEICVGQIETKIFDMIRAIAQKNGREVFFYYHDMLAAKEPPMRILALIVRQFRQMMLLKDMQEAHLDYRTMAQRAGIPDFAVKKNLALARNFTMEQIQSLLREAADCEQKVKTGQLDEQMAVELLMMKYSK